MDYRLCMQNAECAIRVEGMVYVMQHDGNTKSNDGRIGTVFGMEIMLRFGYSCRMECKCNVTGIQRVMMDV